MTDTQNLTYAEGIVKFSEDLTDIGVFEENVMGRKLDGRTNQQTTAKII